MSTLQPSPSLQHPQALPGQAPPITASGARPWLLPLGAVALAVAAVATGVMIGRHNPPQPEAVAAAAAPSAEATKAAQTAAQTLASPPAAGPDTASRQPRHARSEPATTGSPAPALDTQPARAVAVCAHCGTVESVRTEVRQGQGSGVGAVAGGVVGGLLGNQMGKGNGRAAMTVLGAVGGGLAGNAIEKHQRASTVYVVKVRMDDGTLRSFTRSESWAAGQRVTVDGSSLQAATSAADAAPRERMMQTAERGTPS